MPGSNEIHLYTISLNEERMLPFFFRHYDAFVDRYVFFDDGSTDATLDMLARHPKVEVRRFPRVVKDSFVLSEQALHDAAWKESRGSCDWVIVTDIDEHQWHRSLPNYLAAQKSAGVTVVPSLGFQMISDRFPDTELRLCEYLTAGAAFEPMNKLSIFNPNAIAQTNFAVGRHSAEPVGDVVYPSGDEVLLLHYKYMGMDYLRWRHAMLRKGHGPLDIANGWGHRQRFSEEELLQDFNAFTEQAVDVMDARHVPDRDHTGHRWWQ